MTKTVALCGNVCVKLRSAVIAHNKMSGETVRGKRDTIDKTGMTGKMTDMAQDLIGKTLDPSDQKGMKDLKGKIAGMTGETGKTDRRIKRNDHGESFQSPRHRERMIRARLLPSCLQETSELCLQDSLL